MPGIAPERGTGNYRSWGESQIALMLENQRIPYFHEYPVGVVDGGKTRLWYPDFRLADYGVLVEYCGMAGKPDYDAGMEKKKLVYRENGMPALMLKPDYFRGNWPKRLLDEVEKTLQGRLDSYRKLRYGR